MSILTGITDIVRRCEEQSAGGPVVFLGRVRKPLFIVVCVVSFSLVLFGSAIAQDRLGEYELKAAFLYNFAKFVEWPAEAFSHQNAPLVIGIVGDDPFNGSLNQLNGKNANGRQVVVKRLSVGQDLRSCHILFVSSSERKRLDQITSSLKGASVLTVSDMDGFVYNGGIIGLVMEGSKVRFLVNEGAADRARVKISSRLLSLAKKVVY